MKKQISTVTAFRRNLEKIDFRRGFNGDYRKKGTCAVFSYYTRAGIEFRRAFWLPGMVLPDEMLKVSPAVIEVPEE